MDADQRRFLREIACLLLNLFFVHLSHKVWEVRGPLQPSAAHCGVGSCPGSMAHSRKDRTSRKASGSSGYGSTCLLSFVAIHADPCYLNSWSSSRAASLRSGRGLSNPSFPFRKYVMIVPLPCGPHRHEDCQ